MSTRKKFVYITFLVVLFYFLSNNTAGKTKSLFSSDDGRDKTYRYVKSLVQVKIKDPKRVELITTFITNNGYKYNINPTFIARQIMAESEFNKNAESFRYKKIITWEGKVKKTNFVKYGPPVAFGIAQIREIHWAYLLYRVDNGSLRESLLQSKNPVADHIRYLKMPKYAIEVQCMIMRHLENSYGDYRIALLAYWAGPGTTGFEYWRTKPEKNDYVKDIYYGEVEKPLKKYFDWKDPR
jgi:soluble lytic murein transglycosylase-like protein